MGLLGSVKATTPLYHEMYICSEILGGMPHYKFMQLPKEERMKWYFFAEMKMKKESYFHKKQIDRMEAKRLQSAGRRRVR